MDKPGTFGSVADGSLELAEGVRLWRDKISADGQRALIAEIFEQNSATPFYRPTMPRSERPFSVEETNFGPLGWYSGKHGYCYRTTHPYTDQVWPPIPRALQALWDALTFYPAPPECCLVNLYRGDARMGLHQDRDEADLAAPVLSISLGDNAVFRFGGVHRRDPTRVVKLSSGDVVLFGGPARLMFHGIDRVLGGSSRLVPGGGRLNLTLRRVTKT
jgi:DNA oxidative demethylase